MKVYEKHEHDWKQGADITIYACKCGAVRLSKEEYERRMDKWNSYRSDVRNTKSYNRYIEQKQAFLANNMERVKQLAEEAGVELKNKTDWLPKPPFPDPTTWGKYVIETGEPTITQYQYAKTIFD